MYAVNGSYLAKLRNAFELLRSGDLPMVAGDALMIRECWHAPFGHFVHVPQVREENPGRLPSMAAMS